MLSLIHQAMEIAEKGMAHKWPEEKPKESGEYLICEQQFKSIYVAWYNDEAFYEHIGGDSYELDVLYWWNLPEVKEGGLND